MYKSTAVCMTWHHKYKYKEKEASWFFFFKLQVYSLVWILILVLLQIDVLVITMIKFVLCWKTCRWLHSCPSRQRNYMLSIKKSSTNKLDWYTTHWILLCRLLNDMVWCADLEVCHWDCADIVWRTDSGRCLIGWSRETYKSCQSILTFYSPYSLFAVHTHFLLSILTFCSHRINTLHNGKEGSLDLDLTCTSDSPRL